jgi:hypothetical protein
VYVGTNPAISGATAHAVTLTGTEDASGVAAAFAAVIDGLDDVTATAASSVVSARGIINGDVGTPAFCSSNAAVATTQQIGGTSTAEIGGQETATGTLVIPCMALYPRKVRIAFGSRTYEIVQYPDTLTTAGLVVQAGFMSREDRTIKP